MSEVFVVRDLLYGKISLPWWLRPALSLPEFSRLRGVRQSNLDSFEFKDFAFPTRAAHGIGSAYLATLSAKELRLPLGKTVELTLAALLHDVATPPFGHTAERAIGGFDHEIESLRVLLGRESEVTQPGFPVYASQLGQFEKLCRQLSARLGESVSAEAVAEMIVGEGELGFLVAGAIDLDNIDNVTRALAYMGEPVDRELPIRLVKQLASATTRLLDLRDTNNSDVQLWLEYRDTLYASFFYASAEEIGRQAFLEHIMRRALDAGLPPRDLVWCTDDEFFRRLELIPREGGGAKPLAELVSRYRLLEAPKFVVSMPLTEDDVRVLSAPAALRWLEDAVSTPATEFMVTTQRPRFRLSPAVARRLGQLYTAATPSLHVYALSATVAVDADDASESPGSHPRRPTAEGKHVAHIAGRIAELVECCRNEAPWMGIQTKVRRLLPLTLDSVGDWSFRLSRNESFHPYPSTFVHALPTTLLRALDLAGRTVLDPFGGTGETAMASVRLGGAAMIADVNRVALLAAQARMAYLSSRDRRVVRAFTVDDIRSTRLSVDAPDIDLTRWHHRDTIRELRRILSFIDGQASEVLRTFMSAAVSAILPLTTGRRGKQNSYFADNTPLPRDVAEPPYVSACDLFLARLQRNLGFIERLYATLEASDRKASEDLARVEFRRADARTLTPAVFGSASARVDAVVTSPPYLCAVDYTLGSRLSYYWLFPGKLEADFGEEIGARRKRNSPPEETFESYIADLGAVAQSLRTFLRRGALVVLIIGEPRAQAFRHLPILARVDAELEARDMPVLWTKWRPVQWHRNHGYASIMSERIAVYEVK